MNQKSNMHVDGGVGRPYGTDEVPEQKRETVSGGRGGKATDQREPRPRLRVGSTRRADCSVCESPGRSQHQALDALWVGLIRKKVNWVLDADIRDFFGSISHEWLGKFIEHRIAD